MISATLVGFKELNEQLKQLNDAALSARVLAQACRKAFMPVFIEAHRLAPHRSGALVEAIKLTVVTPKDGDASVIVGLRIAGPKKVFGPKTKTAATTLSPKARWHFIEFGTAHMAAHPFLRPALDRKEGEVIELLKAELNKSIERAVYRQVIARGKAAGA